MNEQDQLLPNDPQAEEGILCCLIGGTSLNDLVQQGLDPSWFYDLRHRYIYLAISHLVQTGVKPDVLTVTSVLRQSHPDLLNIISLVSSIEAAGSPANVSFWFEILQEKYLRRSAITANTRLQVVLEDPTVNAKTLVTELADVTDNLRRILSPNGKISLCSLADLPPKTRSDPNELLRFRFLCRTGGLLLCGPTGVGKSSFCMQTMILWATGKPAFGITPTGPLKSLLIQAENDEADLGEMRDGVTAGLELDCREIKIAYENIRLCRDDAHSGPNFFSHTLIPLLEGHKPDLLWIDPVLAYLGGEVGSQKDVGGWLRNGLNPILAQFNCAAVVVHHTNKPPSGKEKPTWSNGDFAYLGSGSAEWANWARAVIAIRSTGTPGVFELVAPKRGGRLSWKDKEGNTAYSRFIGHSADQGIYWTETEGPQTPGRPKEFSAQELFELLPDSGFFSAEWLKTAKIELGVSERSYFRLRSELETDGKVIKSKLSKKWVPKLTIFNP